MSIPLVEPTIPDKEYVFILKWPETATVLTLNFKPLVELFNLEVPFVLSHFQAVPYGHRSFGYFYVDKNRYGVYYTLLDNQIEIQSMPKQVSLDEFSVPTTVRPTAGYLFAKSILVPKEGKWILKSC